MEFQVFFFVIFRAKFLGDDPEFCISYQKNKKRASVPMCHMQRWYSFYKFPWFTSLTPTCKTKSCLFKFFKQEKQNNIPETTKIFRHFQTTIWIPGLSRRQIDYIKYNQHFGTKPENILRYLTQCSYEKKNVIKDIIFNQWNTW